MYTCTYLLHTSAYNSNVTVECRRALHMPDTAGSINVYKLCAAGPTFAMQLLIASLGHATGSHMPVAILARGKVWPREVWPRSTTASFLHLAERVYARLSRQRLRGLLKAIL
jgi:hypothetical protein